VFQDKVTTIVSRIWLCFTTTANKDLDYHLFTELFHQSQDPKFMLLLSMNKKTKKQLEGKIKIFDITFMMFSLKLSSTTQNKLLHSTFFS